MKYFYGRPFCVVEVQPSSFASDFFLVLANVNSPTQAVVIFGDISTAFGTLAIR